MSTYCSVKRRLYEKSQQRIRGLHHRLGRILPVLCQHRQAHLRSSHRDRAPEKFRNPQVGAQHVVSQSRKVLRTCAREKGNTLSSNRKKRVGIVLFQLGGPDSLETVEPFLRNLFSDPDIIPLGPLDFVRGPLARYIAKKRTPPVAGRYAMIGRRSPIAILTERQRVRLVRSLEPYIDPVAVTAMRYWKPLTEDAVAVLKSAGHLDELVLLPLYP